MPTICPGKAASKKLRRLQKAWERHNINGPSLVDITSPSSLDTAPTTQQQQKMTTIQEESPQDDRRLEQYEESDLIITSLLISGGFSNVFKAYHKENSECNYAIKKFQSSVKFNSKLFPTCAADMALETALLASLRHDNIIGLRGIRGDAPPLQLLKNGTFFLCMDPLHDTLQDKLEFWRKEAKRTNRHRSLTFSSSKHKHDYNSSIIQRLENIALGIVKGLEYLHSNNIIYRDLKPGNIGFDHLTNEVKIFDFGLARVGVCNDITEETINKDRKQRGERLMTRFIGTPRYMAPEIARGDADYGFAVDVYSFSILLWQLVTDCIAYGKVENPDLLQEMVSKHQLRPSSKVVPKLLLLLPLLSDATGATTFSDDDDSSSLSDHQATITKDTTLLQELLESSWSGDPKKRPTVSDIREELEFIIDSNPMNCDGETKERTVLSKGKRRLFRFPTPKKINISKPKKINIGTSKNIRLNSLKKKPASERIYKDKNKNIKKLNTRDSSRRHSAPHTSLKKREKINLMTGKNEIIVF